MTATTDNNGEPSRARTCDPLIKSLFSVVSRSPAQSGTDELAQIIRKKWTMLSWIVGGRQGVPAKLAH